jgi:hypothetical protein
MLTIPKWSALSANYLIPKNTTEPLPIQSHTTYAGMKAQNH